MAGSSRSGRAAEATPPDALDPDRPIAVTHYDTDAVPPEARHAAWTARGWPSIAALFSSRPIGDFSTDVDRVMVDGLIVQFASGTARDIDRSTHKARSDGVDLLGVGVEFDGALSGTAQGRPFVAPANSLLFLDMAQSSAVRLPGGRSLQLALPKAMAEENFGPTRRLHGLVIEPARGAMLVSHLLHLREALPQLTEHQQPRLARTVIDMLAIALDRSGARQRPQLVAGRDMLAAVKREIETRLGLPSLTVPSLCATLRISRSALYRMFEAEGGVEAYIRGRRLEQVRLALLNPANGERIVDLAYRWGFSDASHLGRQFRDAYGTTPRAFREDSAKP